MIVLRIELRRTVIDDEPLAAVDAIASGALLAFGGVALAS
jgi:hypothetical protein